MALTAKSTSLDRHHGIEANLDFADALAVRQLSPDCPLFATYSFSGSQANSKLDVQVSAILRPSNANHWIAKGAQRTEDGSLHFDTPTPWIRLSVPDSNTNKSVRLALISFSPLEFSHSDHTITVKSTAPTTFSIPAGDFEYLPAGANGDLASWFNFGGAKGHLVYAVTSSDTGVVSAGFSRSLGSSRHQILLTAHSAGSANVAVKCSEPADHSSVTLTISVTVT